MSEITNIYCQKEFDGDYTVRRKDGTILIEDLEEDEAREIVCRWNSHDALLDACKAWEKYTESENDTRSFDGLRIQYLKKAIKLTETAIKLAEKED